MSDDIMRDYFKIEPPRFSVTTATLVFPAAVELALLLVGAIIPRPFVRLTQVEVVVKGVDV